jgi:hypothetical protein
MNMFYVGTCSVCGGGNVGIRVSASGCCIVGLCDECDAVWLEPRLTRAPLFPEQPHLPCPDHGSSLRDAGSHWADRGEVEAAGWADVIIGQTTEY